MSDLTMNDFEEELYRWGKWAYINVDKMLGARPPGWVFDMKRGYELDNRRERQNRINPMDDDVAPDFDKIVCKLASVSEEYLKVIVLYYCFHASLSKLDRAKNKPKNHHARVRESAFSVLYGIAYGSKIAV